MNPQNRLQKVYGYFNTNASDIEKRYKDLVPKTKFSKQTLYNIESGLTKNITVKNALIIKEVFPEINLEWLTTGNGEMIENDYKNPLQQLKEVQKKKNGIINNNNEGYIPNDSKKVKCYTTVIPIAGQAGLFKVFFDDLYLEQNFVKEEILVNADERDDYTDLGVAGDSMYPTLKEGDRVRCKDVRRLHWTDHRYFKFDKVYCFWHNKRGIIFKRVKSYIQETMILSSDNEDKKQYPDFEIDINYCSRILVVTEIVSRKI